MQTLKSRKSLCRRDTCICYNQQPASPQNNICSPGTVFAIRKCCREQVHNHLGPAQHLRATRAGSQRSFQPPAGVLGVEPKRSRCR